MKVRELVRILKKVGPEMEVKSWDMDCQQPLAINEVRIDNYAYIDKKQKYEREIVAPYILLL